MTVALMGFQNGGGQSLGFSIDLRRRPYNTLALPCECVIEFSSSTKQRMTNATLFGRHHSGKTWVHVVTIWCL